jgi:predicted metal-binding membrane protein
MVQTQSDQLLVQRYIILVLLLILSLAAWTLLVRQGLSDDGHMAMATTPTMGMSAPLFLAVWVTMMVAMMFPTAAPMILTFHKLQSSKRQRGETFVATWLFVAGYLLVWTLSGIAAYAAAVAVELIARSSLPPTTAARIGGLVLIAAGLYQLTPLKHVCLSKCRTPISFIMTSWRDGVGGAVRMGLLHGAYCLGCCWLLFGILFPLGIMNVAAMIVVTFIIFAEKSMPWGRRVTHITAAGLAAYGVAVLVVPEALPTFQASGGIAMTQQGAPVDTRTMPMSRSASDSVKQ